MQSLNYAAQAMKGMQAVATTSPPENRECMLRLCEIISRSVHFQIPPGGKIFDDNLKCIRSTNFTLKLPFPAITVSYSMPSWVRGGINGPLQTATSKKRCAIAWEQDSKIFMVSAFDTNINGVDDAWTAACIGCIFDPMHWESPRSALAISTPSKNNDIAHPDPTARVTFAPFIVLPDTFRFACEQYGKLSAIQAGNDDNDDVFSILELMEALSCSNVSHELIQRANPTVNARRIRAGKLPLYEIHALTITAPQRKAATKELAGGTHASPREHLRRGHIRNLTDGRKIWVQSCVVNVGSQLGRVDKTYSVVRAKGAR